MRRAVLLAIVLAACQRGAAERPFTLRVAVLGPLRPLHPRLTESSAMLAHDLVYEGVLYPGDDGRPRSRIARSVVRLGPGRFRLELDPEARFSDGSPVTAADVARALVPAGAAVRDEGAAVVVSGPPATLEATLLYTVVYREVAGRFLGTAAFRVVEQTENVIRLERVRHAPGRIDRVEVVAFPGERDAIAHTLRGDTNALVVYDVHKLEFFEGIPTLQVVRGRGPQARAIELNDAALGAARRHAIQAALPVADLIRAGCGPGDAPIGQPQLRESTGAPRAPLRVLVNASEPLQRRTGLAIRRAFGSARVRIEAVSNADFLRASRGRDHDLVIGTPLVWPPAAIALRWGTGGSLNTSGFSSPDVDAALAGGDADRIQPEVQRDAPVVLLCRRERGLVVDARVRNPTLSPWGYLESVPDWEVAP